jgi:hypothetical protein
MGVYGNGQEVTGARFERYYPRRFRPGSVEAGNLLEF